MLCVQQHHVLHLGHGSCSECQSSLSLSLSSHSCSCSNIILKRQDVDIVVFGQQHDTEQIKAYLESTSNQFSHQNARDPNNYYTVLHFNLSYSQGKWCWVDILVSGCNSPMGIPKIPESHVDCPNNYNIPVMPFLVLLILKVQGWKDHCVMPLKPWHQGKIPQDIQELLDMLDNNDHLDYYNWLPKWFIKHPKRLVGKYTDKYPHTASLFRSMVFNV